MKPDRLTEIHVISELTRDTTFAKHCLSELDERQVRQAAIILGRASLELPPARQILQHLLLTVEQDFDPGSISVGVLSAIVLAINIPYAPVPLARAKLAMIRRIIENFPEKEPPAKRAIWLYLYSDALVSQPFASASEEGDNWWQAVDTLKEAIEIYRILAAASPDENKLPLAKMLLHLSQVYIHYYINGGSLRVSTEAVEILEQLVAADPARYRRDLAKGLCIHAGSLRNMNRLRDAGDAIDRAIDIYTELSSSGQTVEKSNFGHAIHEQSLICLRAGHHDIALDLALEAVTLFSESAVSGSDGTDFSLAVAKRNAADTLGKLGRWNEAVDFQQDAVSILRRLYDLTGRHRTSLIVQLQHLADMLSRVGREIEETEIRNEIDLIKARRDGPRSSNE